MNFLSVFQPYVKNLKPIGGGPEYLGFCPFHEDTRPSLSVNLRSGLWHCHSLACGAEGDAMAFLMKLKGINFKAAQAEIAQLTDQEKEPARKQARSGDKIVTSYDYLDEAGKLLFQVVRLEPKGFRQRRPDGNGDWIWSLKGVRRVLYRLPELLRAEIVFVCEGEKDADNLRELGLVATTCPMGAGKWRPEYSNSLQGKQVIILPDNDEPGRAHAREVAKTLHGVAASVKIVELSGLPLKGDVSDWLTAGGTKEELLKLAAETEEWQLQAVGTSPEPASPPRTVEIKDEAPEAIQRPLCLVGGHAYAAAWLWVHTTDHQTVDEKGRQVKHDPPLVHDELALSIIRNDGVLFSDGPIPGARPLSELGVTVHLPEVPPASHTWSGAGVKRFLAGERPDPSNVFRWAAEVIDRFMDFNRSLSPQQTMCELLACYVLATYGLDALSVIGYLWPNAMHGAGKTKCLNTVTGMAYLGQTILAGGSYASLRDLADYGATLAFDDAENVMDVRKADPDKRALLLAGNRRGATITIKEPVGKRGWITRYINAFCPRLFSAIKLPDLVLASRAIIIPLVRSADDRKANFDPCDWEAWPHHRRRLIDDLWAMGLMALPRLKHFDQAAAAKARLSGRNLEPWRAILAVALWLQEEHGAADLFDRMEALSVTYQSERDDLETADPVRVAILALRDMAASQLSDGLRFQASQLAEAMNRVAEEMELGSAAGEKFTNAVRVGKLLKRLRIGRATRDARRRTWLVAESELEALAITYGIAPVGSLQPVTPVTPVNLSPGGGGSNDGMTGMTGMTGDSGTMPHEEKTMRDPAQPVPLFTDVAGAALTALGEQSAKAAYRANPPAVWSPETDAEWWASLRSEPPAQGPTEEGAPNLEVFEL